MSTTSADGDLLGTSTGLEDDPDGDGLSTGDEWALGTDPYDADTNDDGILDGIAHASGMSATDPDMDDDGVLNGAERAQGTDPFNADTDGDLTNDGTDDFPLDPTRTTAPSSNPSDTTPPTITLDEPTNATLISSIPPMSRERMATSSRLMKEGARRRAMTQTTRATATSERRRKRA